MTRVFFQTKMTELVFVKTEYDAVAVKEEYVEKADPLKITSNIARGSLVQ